MVKDLYDVLQVPFNANDAWIKRAYEARKQEVTGDSTLDSEQKSLKLAALDEALATLGNEVRRSRYDSRLKPKESLPLGQLLLKALLSPLGIAFVILCMLGAGYAMNAAKQERQRKEAEEQRIAREADLARQELARRESEAQARQAALEQKRQEQREEQQRRQFERDRRGIGYAPSEADMQAQDKAQRITAAQQAQQQAEAAQRREEAEARMRAREEAARRERFLRERERR